MKRLYLPLLVLAMTVASAAYGADSDGRNSSSGISAGQATTMKIRLKIRDRVITATLVDSETARDFKSILPLTLTMNDLFRREKYGHLPRALSEGGERVKTFHVGDVIYWSPGPDIAIIFRQGGPSIPDPGIITIARIDTGSEVLDVPGTLAVTIESDQQ